MCDNNTQLPVVLGHIDIDSIIDNYKHIPTQYVCNCCQKLKDKSEFEVMSSICIECEYDMDNYYDEEVYDNDDEDLTLEEMNDQYYDYWDGDETDKLTY